MTKIIFLLCLAYKMNRVKDEGSFCLHLYENLLVLNIGKVILYLNN